MCVCSALLVLGVTGDAGAASTSSCPSFKWKANGTPWQARQIRVRKVSCSDAGRLIRSYARPRNCRFIAPCRIQGLRCETNGTSGSVFRETCTRGKRLVSWRGSYMTS